MRVELVGDHTEDALMLDPQDKVRTPTTNLLHAEVAAMNGVGLSIMHMHLEAASMFNDQKGMRRGSATAPSPEYQLFPASARAGNRRA